MISRSYWLALPKETRQKLALLLEVPRSGSSEVFGTQIISDGYTDKDLSTINLKKLQDFMISKSSNFYELLDELVKRVETPPQEINAPKEVANSTVEVESSEVISLKLKIKDLEEELDKLKNPNKYLYNTVSPELVQKTIPPVKVHRGRPKKITV